MTKHKTEKTGNGKTAQKDTAAEIANILKELIIAFILALLVITFVMQAFRIPTGSMADTLMGAHFRLRCLQCGYKYNYGFIPERYKLPPDVIPRGYIKPIPSRCPSCGYYQPVGGTMPIENGDRILVLKCIYQFFEPKRWDVVVFKNPIEPQISYIKRLIGRAGETVEIIDGDIYINGQINRKPPKVQNELWMPVYDNDYQPARPKEGSFNGHFWEQPFKNVADSTWKLDEINPAQFQLDSSAEQINTLFYDTSIGNDFKSTYAYDDVDEYKFMPYCSDLMIRFYMQHNSQEGRIGATLSKYKTTYSAWVDFAGDMVITKTPVDEETVELAHQSIKLPAINKTTLVKFANIDHQLIFQLGKEKLVYDLGPEPNDAGPRLSEYEPEAKIFGSGKLKLSHIAIFRDIHYTGKKFATSARGGRAIEGEPLVLGEDEFFVLGDNSPSSADGRWWNRRGIANKGKHYRAGIVPRDYLVGKAFFVYWPGGFRPFVKSRLAIIPNFGQMRFIYGGSDKKDF